jgi:hypothetical protein
MRLDVKTIGSNGTTELYVSDARHDAAEPGECSAPSLTAEIAARCAGSVFCRTGNWKYRAARNPCDTPPASDWLLAGGHGARRRGTGARGRGPLDWPLYDSGRCRRGGRSQQGRRWAVTSGLLAPPSVTPGQARAAFEAGEAILRQVGMG